MQKWKLTGKDKPAESELTGIKQKITNSIEEDRYNVYAQFTRRVWGYERSYIKWGLKP